MKIGKPMKIIFSPNIHHTVSFLKCMDSVNACVNQVKIVKLILLGIKTFFFKVCCSLALNHKQTDGLI